MNFLAHLWLAEATHTSMAGAMLGDMVHGRLERTDLPPELAQGVRIHRRIDAVTDRHPLSQGWRERFPPGTRRHAGIVLDLLCDHALALDWACVCEEPLPRFAMRAGEALACEHAWFQHYGSWSPRAPRFAALLCSYAEWQGFERAVEKTAGRLRRPQPLLDAGACAAPLLQAVRAGLPALMADLQAAAVALRDATAGCA